MCCNPEAAQFPQEPCSISPYAVEECEGKHIVGEGDVKKPIKGILKNAQATPIEMAAATAGRTAPGQEEPTSKPPVPNELRPVPQGSAPCYLPQPLDGMPDERGDKEMGPIGPWATGRVDWGPLSGLTGTRPVVDKYSITRYSEGEWRQANKDMLDMATTAQHKANL